MDYLYNFTILMFAINIYLLDADEYLFFFNAASGRLLIAGNDGNSHKPAKNPARYFVPPAKAQA